MVQSDTHRIALTIDVEDWYHIPAVTGSNFSFYPDVPAFMRYWDKRYDYLTTPTQTVLGLLQSLDVRATFFIIADVVEYYPGLVESIAAQGHEIGCHGLHHALKIHPDTKKPMFTVSEFEDRTGRAREILQNTSGQPVQGYRAPGAFFGQWMFDILIKLGFSYDSSVSPNTFFNKTDMDTRALSSAPYVVHGAHGRLVEMPWPYYQTASIRFPTGGGPFLRFFPAGYLISGLRQSLKRGHTLFYFHPLDIQRERLPFMVSRNRRRPFYFMTSGKRTERKLRKILAGFASRWTTCGDIVHLCLSSSMSERFRAVETPNE